MALWTWPSLLLVIFCYLSITALGCAIAVLPVLFFWALPRFATFFLAVAGVIAGLAALRQMIPSRQKSPWTPAESNNADDPKLHEEIAYICRTLQIRPPDKVSLDLDVKMYLHDGIGFFGLGAKREMRIGLPLLRLVTVAQFRALAAHELGHYYRGDTLAGPCFHKAYRLLTSSRLNLQQGKESDALRSTNLPWVLYQLTFGLLTLWTRLILRVTRPLARLQEYRADELASRLAGARPMIEGLLALDGSQPALPAYIARCLEPVVRTGFRPPVAEGFARFILTPEVTKVVGEHLDADVKNRADRATALCPLRDRIETIQSYELPEIEEDDRAAIALLGDVSRAEQNVLHALTPIPDALCPIPWEHVGMLVYVRRWRVQLAETIDVLSGYTLAQLPEVIADAAGISSRMKEQEGTLLTWEQRKERVTGMLPRAVAVALCDHGWEYRAGPGESFAEHGPFRLSPGQVVKRLMEGSMSAAEWRALCNDYGISRIPFTQATQSAAAATSAS